MKTNPVPMQTAQIDKQELIAWIENLNDRRTLRLLQSLKNSQTEGDWWDKLPQEVKDSIDQGLADIEAGRVTPHEEVRKTYEQWL
jgi:predicted transcriptional regulator